MTVLDRFVARCNVYYLTKTKKNDGARLRRPPFIEKQKTERMEKAEIQERVKSMQTVEDLANLLNELKTDEFGVNRYQITEKQLLHFSIANIEKRYKKFLIKKKSGGTREINAPCYQLAIILHFLNQVLRAVYTPHPCATGFTEGRSVVDNAQTHVGHHYVFNIDLQNFFPSIPQPRVWARIQLPPFNFKQEIANVVAGLCCNTNPEGTGNALPQGAATSPLLSNAVCDKLDRRMRGVARRFGLHYSRYADDMTFSSMHNVYQEGSEFRQEIKRIIEEQGFKMNDKKTRLLRDGQRQEVTGLTVNALTNVSRKYISDLRWILRVWEVEGYAKAYSKFYPKYKAEKGYIKKGEPVMENVIGGKLNYLRMVRGENNPAYQKLQARYDSLQQIILTDNETDKEKSYTYVQPYKMEEFKEQFHTDVTLVVTEKKKLTGKCVLAGTDKQISISKSTQKSLCPDLDKHAPGDVISSTLLDSCHVTLCRAKGKNFWLITEFEPKRSRCLSVQNAQIDVDLLLKIWEMTNIEYAAYIFHQAITTGEPLPSLEELEKKGIMIHHKPDSRTTGEDGSAIDEPTEVIDWPEEPESINPEELAKIQEEIPNLKEERKKGTTPTTYPIKEDEPQRHTAEPGIEAGEAAS